MVPLRFLLKAIYSCHQLNLWHLECDHNWNFQKKMASEFSTKKTHITLHTKRYSTICNNNVAMHAKKKLNKIFNKNLCTMDVKSVHISQNKHN